MRKRLASCLLAAVMVMTSLVGCGNDGNDNKNSDSSAGNSGNSSTQEESSASSGGEREKVVFWYSHTGDEAVAFEKAIASYNASQDKYEVEGLSVSDKQKIIVAISGNESPDVVDVSSQDILSYATNGLIESISDMADAEGFPLTELFSTQALTANEKDGDVYGMPMAAMVIQMFYNKDILKEIGYDEPPKTMEELYEMAVKATEVDESGTITRLGYPLFPLASARQELIYAFGGRWWSEDGLSVTPEDSGILDSLNMNVKYRNLYGIEKVQEFVATANTNRYTENDMFFAGKQLFRFDGTWMAAMMKNFNADVNYGVALIPGTEAHPELAGTSRYETNSLGIPVVAPNKEGAWDFVKYFCTNKDAIKQVLIDTANLPTLLELYDDPDILAQPDFEMFIEALKAENGIQYPKINDLAKYTSLMEEYLDYVYNGMMTPEEGMEKLAEQAALLE